MSKDQNFSEVNDINMIAMQIIMDAGDAREYIAKSISAMEEDCFQQAEKYLADAQEKIKQAHGRQTEVIQDEARGVSHPFSLLFTHAQDTLMTISSELNLAKRFYGVFVHIDSRLQSLEKKEK